MLAAIPDRPISFEVFSDEFDEMERQAREIASWGDERLRQDPGYQHAGASPPTTSSTDSSHAGVKVNVTALLTLDQVRDVVAALAGGAPSYVSVFAGRIADTGRDPVPLMARRVEILRDAPNAELIWASPRELLNIFQADADRLPHHHRHERHPEEAVAVGKDLDDYSLETVKMFHDDAEHAGYEL